MTIPVAARKSPPAATCSNGAPPKSALARVTTGCALAVMALGLAVMAGWLLGLEPLKRMLPQLATMKFNTALGFLLAGAALCFRERPAVRFGLAGATVLLGALTLGQYLAGSDFGIDQLVIRDLETPVGRWPGRMSPATALCFLLSGAALGLLGLRAAERWAEALAIGVGTVGFIALLGYTFGAQNLHSIPGFASLAPHTATGFALLAAGLLCAMPGGIVVLLLRSSGTTERSLWLGFGALTALLIILGVVSGSRLHSIGADVDAQADVARPRADAARELEVNILDYGLSVRVFLAGEAAARERTKDDARAVAECLAEYERLAETPRQRELAARFSDHWQTLHTLGEALMAAGTASPQELTRLASLRLALEHVLDDEMQPEAVAAYNAHRKSTQETLNDTESISLLLLIGGVVLALVTSGGVIRAVVTRDEAVRASNQRRADILGSVTDGFHVIDAQWRLTEFNAAARAMYAVQGVDANALIGRHIVEEAFPEANELPAVKALRRTMTERVPTSVENLFEPWQRYFSVRHFPTPDGGAATFFADITERKRAEETLAAQQRLYKSVTDNASGAMFIMDDKQQCSFMNPAAEQLTGYTLEETRGRTLHDVVHHTHRDGSPYPLSECPIDQAFPEQNKMQGEEVFVHKDGHFYDVAFTASPLRDARSMSVGTIIEVQDIIGRKRAEAALVESAELRARTAALTEQNSELELARRTLEEKAAELALTSKYKSEFLANMSHELRTPLNAILIFSQQLAENKAGNLTGKQVEFSRHIHSSGTDLLHLISDILDLSKIESGTVTVEVEEIPFAELHGNIDRNFRHVAEAKSLPLNVHFAEGLPRVMASDPKRLQQILKNLLSNAVKFTAHGKVEVRVDLAKQGWSPDHPVLSKAPQVVAFAVEDTGIGIAPEKQRIIFEAFQQADAGTSRKYGGTGLGLAISRGLAVLLGGEVKIVSVHGQGSTFTLYLPLHCSGPDSARRVPTTSAVGEMARALSILPAARAEHIEDDRNHVTDGDSVLLIIEDDPHYARILLGMARDKGFKGVVATKGKLGLSLARQLRPAAISLDIFLPDMLGWAVLNQLKLDPATRHIPVQVISVEEERQHGLAHGAFSYLVKSSTTESMEAAFDRMVNFTAPRTKRLLIVEDDGIERQAIVELLGHKDIAMVAVATGGEALEAMLDQPFDCVVLDLRLPDMTGFELLEKVQAEPTLADVPVVVFTGKELTAEEHTRLKAMAKSIVLKDVQSPERLLDETALFLHRVVTDLPAEKQAILERLHGSNDALVGRKVLVVDDDARNIFALTSLLEDHEMDVISATNGRSAIEIIQRTPELSLVLMDVMMPGMDGYETMREIRGSSKFRTLPILALTAKAMKGDREKCLDAGASDYIAKPVNTDQLLSLMRVWLFR